MRNRVLIAFAAVCAAVLALAGPASAAKRIALVVGNDDYENLSKLAKAVIKSPSAIERLEALIHPLVRKAERAFLRAEAARGNPA